MIAAAELLLFTDFKFNDRQKASSLFEFLNATTKTFIPQRCDTQEPVRKPYTPDKLEEATDLLSGYPEHLYGEIFLQGANGTYLAWLRWTSAKTSLWHIYLAKGYLSKSSNVEELLEFTIGLCNRFPPLYGGIAAKEDWDAKHKLLRTSPTGGESHEKVGLDITSCLPGIYWTTIFGPAVSARLELKKRTSTLPIERAITLNNGGTILVLRKSPVSPELSERLSHDQEIIDAIGAEYFFDKNHPEKKCPPVVEVEKSQPSQTGEAKLADDAGGEDTGLSDFENQPEESLPNAPYTGTEDLAGNLVTFVHMEVEDVFGYSRDALEALDGYLAQNPQSREYSHEHLFREFMPALGAYLGETLVAQLGGEWVRGKALFKSKVNVHGKLVSPFRVAYRAVFEGAKLTEVYDAVA